MNKLFSVTVVLMMVTTGFMLLPINDEMVFGVNADFQMVSGSSIYEVGFETADLSYFHWGRGATYHPMGIVPHFDDEFYLTDGYKDGDEIISLSENTDITVITIKYKTFLTSSVYESDYGMTAPILMSTDYMRFNVFITDSESVMTQLEGTWTVDIIHEFHPVLGYFASFGIWILTLNEGYMLDSTGSYSLTVQAEHLLVV